MKFQRVVSVVFLIASLHACTATTTRRSDPFREIANARIPKNRLVIHGLGDLNLGHKLPQELKQSGRDFDNCFDNTRGILRAGDFNFANLESPATRSETRVEKQYTFTMNPESLGAIKRAKIDIVSLANNHALDAGEEGLSDTIRFLDQNQIAYVGAGKNLAEARRAIIKEAKGFRIGFLAYSYTHPQEFYASESKPGTAFGHLAQIKTDLEALRARTDLIAIGFHWGEELTTHPKDYQIENAHFAIDNGADIIFGHHPHVIQGIEIYRKKPIFYSLGNYVFGTFSNNAKIGFIPRVIAKSHCVETIELFPLNVYAFEARFNPIVLRDAPAKAVLNEIRIISERFKTLITDHDGIGVIQPSSGN